MTEYLDYKKLPFYGGPLRPLAEKVFPDYLDEVKTLWKRKWGGQGLGRLRTVIAHRPGPEADVKEITKDPAIAQLLNLPEGVPDLEKMQKEHDELIAALKSEGVEIIWADFEPPFVGYYGLPLRSLCYCGITLINGGFIGDRSGMVYWFGAITERWNKKFAELGIPTLIKVTGKGMFECANMRWLNSKSCILATSIRTNMEGIEQVIPVLKRTGTEEIHIAHLPSYLHTRDWQVADGSGTFHLDMVFGMTDYNIGVVYPSCIDYDTIRYLEGKGIKLIECTTKEVHLCAPNLLVIEPGKVIIPAHCDHTTKELRKEGVDCIEVELVEFAKGGGGPTCTVGVLTRDGSLPT